MAESSTTKMPERVQKRGESRVKKSTSKWKRPCGFEYTLHSEIYKKKL
jgi:hypothetical protein